MKYMVAMLLGGGMVSAAFFAGIIVGAILEDDCRKLNRTTIEKGD